MSKHAGFTGFIKRHPLASMYLIMFGLAWSVMIPKALYSQGLLSTTPPELLEILIGWSPAIASIIIAAAVNGSAGVRQLLGRFLVWRVGFQWYLVSVFLLAVIIPGGIGLHILFSGTQSVIPAVNAPLWQTVLSFLALVLIGFLFNTEEVAWRGFALPLIQDKYGALVAAVLIAIPEVTLHLPSFWIKENPFYQTVGIFWFSAFSFAAVIIYVFVFNMTKGSLLFVTLLHSSQNAWSNLLSDNSLHPFQFTVGLMWVVALVLIFITRGKLGGLQEPFGRNIQ